MTTNVTQFPAVQSGGSLILAWQVKGKKVLVVGGGEVSLRSSKLAENIFGSLQSCHHGPLPRFIPCS